MSDTLRPHDLLWLQNTAALRDVTDSWVTAYWHNALPVVVRRDVSPQGYIPVGVRGRRRDQRAAAWVAPEEVTRIVTPEMLVQPYFLSNSPFQGSAPVRAARILSQHVWPWLWGITGSTGYTLATGCPVLHADSDLDTVIRAPLPLDRADAEIWQAKVQTLPCRADTQVETPIGAFSLTEWLRERQVLLKTATGPRLTTHPWNTEPQ